MKIAINGIYLNFKKKNDGIGRYSESLLKEFQQYNEIKFYVFIDRYFKLKGIKNNFSKNIIPVFIPFPTFHIFLLKFWNRYIIPLLLKMLNADLYFAPDALSSYKGAKKYVSTIHDLAFLHFPENVLPEFRKMYNKEYKQAALHSDLLITVSHYSKNDILNSYHIEQNRIKVIYNGVSNHFKTTEVNEQSEILQKYNLDSDYIFYFGTIEPRKNLITLLKAFEKVRETKKLKLVITGKEGWLYSDFMESVNKSKYKNEIILTGYLKDAEVKTLLLNAKVFTYIPVFEGFGLPVVEAMAMGKWIVTSNTSSIPELIDPDTITVDPKDYNAVAEAIKIQLVNAKQNPVNKLAIKKSENFTWQKSAKQHIEEFYKLVNNKK